MPALARVIAGILYLQVHLPSDRPGEGGMRASESVRLQDVLLAPLTHGSPGLFLLHPTLHAGRLSGYALS